jgi:hypothetical protein
MARKSKTNRKLSKKLDKLEKRADGLRTQAEKKGKQLQVRASDRLEDLRHEPEPAKKGVTGKLLVVLAAIGGALVALKKKRDQELDEALWEEPRAI